MTKKEYLNKLVEIVNVNSDIMEAEKVVLIEFLKNEIELLNKKAASKTKKTEESNKALFDTILEVLTDLGRAVTLDELVGNERLATYNKLGKGGVVTIEKMTTQRLASLLSKLREAGKVVKTIEKKKAYYSLMEVEVE